MSALVWLPFEPGLLGDPPSELRYEVVDPTRGVPASVAEVAFYVPPYQVGPRLADVLGEMANLQVVQTLTAGVDNLRGRVPAGVTLCSGRGIHDASTAELAVTLILASLRGIPGFVRAQDRGDWTPGWRPALADKRVVVVGYGAVGRAVEVRLTPFEVDVVRVARSARDGKTGWPRTRAGGGAASAVQSCPPQAWQRRFFVPNSARVSGIPSSSAIGAKQSGQHSSRCPAAPDR